VAALGEPLREGDAFTLWNIPLTADARVITNDVTQGGFNLDALGAATGKPQWTEAVAAALDLDPESDGALDELVVAVPPAFEADGEENDMTRAGLLTVARLADGKWSPESSTAFGGGPQSMTLGVSAPSLSSSRFLWKLRAADVDGDGAKDLVALFSVGKTQTEGPRPRLQVYFNDRNGKLGDPLLVDVPGEDIFDCAWIYADEKSTDTDNKKDLVVLTRPAGDPTGRLAVFVLTANKATRSFSPPKAVGDLSGKVAGGAANGFRTSIAAGDVDADGVDDILVATGSQLLVFKGTPR